ncbi:MAG: response regulator transcription factor [Gammaproteobacteria bacterium]|nr:response regulator transcription factor [Gammaproteobacteria bacterium]
MIHILIVDDQTVVRAGLAAIVGSDPEIEVVGEGGNGEEAVALVSDHAATQVPDLVLMDLQMPVMNGVQATRHLKRDFPTLPILVLTTYAADEWVFDAVRAGAAGYLLKDTRPAQLIAAIKGTVAGETFLDPAIAGKVLKQATRDRAGGAVPAKLIEALTARELEVLALVVKGLNNRQIGDQLHLATGTVRNHVSVIMGKLAVSDRTQAAVLAVQMGLVPLTDHSR